jgi:hypothetical protein
MSQLKVHTPSQSSQAEGSESAPGRSAWFKVLLSQSRILVYVLLVIAIAAASFQYATQRLGNGEGRDRAFFFSLLIISELSFWVSAGICSLFARSFGAAAHSSNPNFWGNSFFPLIAALCGSAAFIVTSPSPEDGVLAFVVVVALQAALGRLSRFTWVEVVEIPAAIAVVWYPFWLMVLASYKDTHHWSYYLGPVYTVLEGGHLLWDSPSQYGFLNILSVATLSRITGLDPEFAMCHLLVALEVLALALTFYFFRFRLRLSTFIAALIAATFHLCLPGWIEEYSGPAYVPSSSAFRFFPSLAALLSFDAAARCSSRVWTLVSGMLMAIALLWSPESCLYTGAPIAAYLFLSLARNPRVSFFVSAPVFTCIVAAVVVGAFLGGYALTLPHGIDFHAFYEYAEAYATFSGTLPIEAELWTVLFVFLISISYLIARYRWREGGAQSAQGVMILVYIMCIATYFIARSNYRNVHNIIPWALTALAAVSCAPASSIRAVQRSVVLTVGSLAFGFFIAYYSVGHNANRIVDRSKAAQVYIPLKFDEFPPSVAKAAREAVKSTAFTVIHDRALFAQNPELGSKGHALPISPLMHFVLLPESRTRIYAQRMVDRVPRSYLLCHERVCPGVPYAFEKMKDILQISPVPFPEGEKMGWDIFEVSKK